ncbi:transmembrane protein 238 [Amia ocellicauda]|uniref:transmembrane protein 238 n=1 Tax=Amia ocellicauda TaxID=2972642 RepID=UPI00346482A3|nr:TM238 protein [Amia calva]
MEKGFPGLGRCSCAFWLAIAFDVFGLVVLMLGVFGDLFFYDFLIYAGAIVIFLSLIWWVFWYTGNIEVPPEELEDDVGLLKRNRGISGLVRRLSSRLSNGIRNSFRRTKRANWQGGVLGGTLPHQTGTGRDSEQPVPVALPMAAAGSSLQTVSATIDSEVATNPPTATETSAI